ncbi:MAG: hypothetical protein IAE81_21435 [Caldilineaceae bacterium]|jgi:hypothetical protein|nr:hypothetical protein [Caldilineaceae bacterium]
MDATTVVEKVVIPEGAAKADVRSLYEVLASVPDRRKPRGKRCSSALVLTLLSERLRPWLPEQHAKQVIKTMDA